MLRTLVLAATSAAAVAAPLMGQDRARALIADRPMDAAVATLGRMDQLLPTTAGGVIVAHGAGQRLLFLDSTGAVIATVERGQTPASDTPGSRMVTLGRWGDRYWAFDEGTLRLSVLTEGGAIVRTVSIPNPLPLRDVSFGLASVEALFPDTSVLFSAARFASVQNITQASSLVRDGHSLLRVSVRGAVLGRFFSLPAGSERLAVYLDEPIDPRAEMPQWGVSADGSRIAYAERVRGASPSVRVVVLSPAGDTLTRAMVPLSSADDWPSTGRLVVGMDGTVWVRAADADGGPRWLIVGRDGQYQGQVRATGDVRVLSLDNGIWGIEGGATGAGRVVRFRLAAP
jgi:hypothetical protein